MDTKNNPPILFSPRENDNGKTPGGGSKEDTTSWILTGSELTDRSEMLAAKINKVIDTWDSADIEGLPHVLTVRIDERAQANTHQRRIVPMFIVGENTGQIGSRGNNALLMKVDSREKLWDIQKNYVDTGKNAHQISAVLDIVPFNPDLDISDPSTLYKIVPLHYCNSSLDERALGIIQYELDRAQLKYEVVPYGENNVYIRVPSISVDSIKFIRSLPIQSIEPVASVVPSFRSLEQSLIPDSALNTYEPDRTYPLVGLLDSGVAQNNLTRDWVSRDDGCVYSDNELNTAHDTYIATLLTHGDRLSSTNDSSFEGCEIVDVPVIPNYVIEEAELVSNIRNAIRCNPDVRIWNLSISLNEEVSENKFY